MWGKKVSPYAISLMFGGYVARCDTTDTLVPAKKRKLLPSYARGLLVFLQQMRTQFPDFTFRGFAVA